MSIDPFRSVVFALAVFRVAYMLALEFGPFGWCEQWRQWLLKWDVRKHGAQMAAEHPHWLLAGFHCPMCLSFWLAIPAAVAVYFPSLAADGVALWLAISGITVVLRTR